MAPQKFRNYGIAGWFYKTVRCHSFWTPTIVFIRLRFCWITITLRSVADIKPCGRDSLERTKKVNSLFFLQNGCLSIITLLRGPKIIIWSHALCQMHHPFGQSVMRQELIIRSLLGTMTMSDSSSVWDKVLEPSKGDLLLQISGWRCELSNVFSTLYYEPNIFCYSINISTFKYTPNLNI